MKYQLEFETKKEITSCYNCPLCNEKTHVLDVGNKSKMFIFAFCEPLGIQISKGNYTIQEWENVKRLIDCPLKEIK